MNRRVFSVAAFTACSLMANLSMAEKFSTLSADYWWVEQDWNGCGAGSSQQPNWVFTTTNNVVSLGTDSKGTRLYTHDYTLPDYMIDTWRMRVTTDYCPKSSSTDDWFNWYHRDCRTGSCFWNDHVDIEWVSQVYLSDFEYADYFECYYVGEAKTDICDRTFMNTGLYTNYALFSFNGYDFNNKYWRQVNMQYFAPPY